MLYRVFCTLLNKIFSVGLDNQFKPTIMNWYFFNPPSDKSPELDIFINMQIEHFGFLNETECIWKLYKTGHNNAIILYLQTDNKAVLDSFVNVLKEVSPLKNEPRSLDMAQLLFGC
jgi:hypothetical protein